MTAPRRASALGLLLLLAACGAAEPAPACDDVRTREKAVREAILALTTQAGSRRIAEGTLVTSGGDTARLTMQGGEVTLATADDRVVGSLNGVRTIATDAETGLVRCGADLILASEDRTRALPATPIEYRSEWGPDRAHDVFVTVLPPAP